MPDARLFNLYALAEKLGRTVHELETGEVAPLSEQEFIGWQLFWQVRAEIEAQQSN